MKGKKIVCFIKKVKKKKNCWKYQNGFKSVDAMSKNVAKMPDLIDCFDQNLFTSSAKMDEI